MIDPNDPTRHYNACLDSVALISDLLTRGELSEDDQDTLARNREHLVTMLARRDDAGQLVLAGFDLGPIQAAVA